jgi:uncharacterized protein YjbI with pentapeptide repeats
MANEEHLALLKQGTAIWHDWRIRNPASLPDLHEADLNGADLSDAKFGATDLRRGEPQQGEPRRGKDRRDDLKACLA